MNQPTLFDDFPQPWDDDAAAEQLTATIVFSKGLEGQFDYLIPDKWVDSIEAGRRVKVPLGRGNRPTVGYCVEVEYQPVGKRKLKEIIEPVDQRTLLSAEMLQLSRWIAERYICPLGAVLETIVPAGVRGLAGTRKTTVLSLEPKYADNWSSLGLPAKQAEVARVLAASPKPLPPSILAKRAGCTQAPITSLRTKGIIIGREDRIDNYSDSLKSETPKTEPHILNQSQQAALDDIKKAIDSDGPETLLIHGVTGSGKTEVYMRAIRKVIEYGRQAIVLVPEISLTPQTVGRFQSRFDSVAVLHSHMTDAARHWHWQQIADGKVQVVVGARSAIFAPLPHLGLIVLDEEHESTFKQETAPRYHAREVALRRSQQLGIPLVLGSATPSLESWYRAKRLKKYKLVEMPHRVENRPMPVVGTIDLRDSGHSRNSRGVISRPLHAAIERAIKDDGQVILLLNRRGYSTHIQCPSCGHVVKCPDCDIALTHHKNDKMALCHYCDYAISAPSVCPECKSPSVRYGGTGTQRLEAEVKSRFAGVSVLRMDTDTMRTRGSHEKALNRFRSGDVRILLGTQMIAKGLDFPNVTLVGVINADTALHLPDFRAAERTFHLVTQVAGRTGRSDRGGRVLVQTFSPEHPAIQAAIRHDFQRFAAGELPLREMLGYPPVASMVRFVVRGPAEGPTERFAQMMADRLKSFLLKIQPQGRILGPAPAPFAKLRGNYRFQIQLQGPCPVELRQVTLEATDDLATPEGIQWIVDVDPLDML
jgi:primosomal protein N' (replication factor Y) (superfamily II helicase)